MELIKLVKWVRSFLVGGFLFLAFALNQAIYLQKPAAPLKFYMEKSHRFIHIIVLQELREDSSITLCLKVIKKINGALFQGHLFPSTDCCGYWGQGLDPVFSHCS